MKKWFLRIVVVLILFLSLQGPELIAQYVDHLTGHVEELKYQVEKLKELTGKQESEFKTLFAEWSKGELKEPGLFISNLYYRFEQLSKDLLAFQQAKFWTLPFVFISHSEGAIVQETLKTYRWGFSFTWSILPFLLLAALFSFLIYLPFRKQTKA